MDSTAYLLISIVAGNGFHSMKLALIANKTPLVRQNMVGLLACRTLTDGSQGPTSARQPVEQVGYLPRAGPDDLFGLHHRGLSEEFVVIRNKQLQILLPDPPSRNFHLRTAYQAVKNMFDNEKQGLLWLVRDEDDLPRRESAAWPTLQSIAAVAAYQVGDRKGWLELTCSTATVSVQSYAQASPDPHNVACQCLRVELADLFLWEFFISEIMALATCAHIYQRLLNASEEPARELNDIWRLSAGGRWERLPLLDRDTLGAGLLRFQAMFPHAINLPQTVADAAVPLTAKPAIPPSMPREIQEELSRCGIGDRLVQVARTILADWERRSTACETSPWCEPAPNRRLLPSQVAGYGPGKKA
jgi:hypothetical protein